MNVLYPNSNAAGPGLLAIMGAASFFVCTVLMENAILQASGHEKLTMVTMISGGLVKIIVNWFLVAQRPSTYTARRSGLLSATSSWR